MPSFRWVYKCTSPNRFRVTRASIRYYTTGGKWISGVHFKYRLVPHGTEGQLQLPHNWSKVKKKSWVANEFNRGRIGAGRLGQTHSTESDWDLEIKLKFVRIGHDYRRKFRIPIAEPDCTATVGPGDFGEGSA